MCDRRGHGGYGALVVDWNAEWVTTDCQRPLELQNVPLYSHPIPTQHVTAKESRERFQKVREAYDILKDPVKRARYDSGQHPG